MLLFQSQFVLQAKLHKRHITCLFIKYMFSSQQRKLVIITLLVLVQAQENSTQNPQTNSHQVVYILVIGLIAALILFILYDRRQNYVYLQAMRNTLVGKFQALVTKFKQIKKPEQSSEKLGMEDQVSTEKQTIGFIQSQKTFIQADIASIQQTTNTSSSMPDQLKQMNFQEETPQVNLKQVFDRKDKKKKNNKSRSKLKNKVQIKKSEVLSDEVEHGQEGVEDLQNSLEYNEA